MSKPYYIWNNKLTNEKINSPYNFLSFIHEHHKEGPYTAFYIGNSGKLINKVKGYINPESDELNKYTYNWELLEN